MSGSAASATPFATVNPGGNFGGSPTLQSGQSIPGAQHWQARADVPKSDGSPISANRSHTRRRFRMRVAGAYEVINFARKHCISRAQAERVIRRARGSRERAGDLHANKKGMPSGLTQPCKEAPDAQGHPNRDASRWCGDGCVNCELTCTGTIPAMYQGPRLRARDAGKL